MIYLGANFFLFSNFDRTSRGDIYAMPNLTIREVPSSTPLDALALMEQFDLRPRDAFHVAVMKSIGLIEIASDDPDFDRVKGIKRIRL